MLTLELAAQPDVPGGRAAVLGRLEDERLVEGGEGVEAEHAAADGVSGAGDAAGVAQEVDYAKVGSGAKHEVDSVHSGAYDLQQAIRGVSESLK